MFDPSGSTPLDPDDQVGLIPTWIATQGDLNRAERENIASATIWVRGQRWVTSDFTSAWLKGLHRRMFGTVWRWAGAYRRRETNLGAAPFQIQVAVEELVDDLAAQLGGTWSHDEIAIRFHHRLVSIHPFPNGNGRHARLVADVLVETLGQPRFDWGLGAELAVQGEARDRYLAALVHADRLADFQPLLSFARSGGG